MPGSCRDDNCQFSQLSDFAHEIIFMTKLLLKVFQAFTLT